MVFTRGNSSKMSKVREPKWTISTKTIAQTITQPYHIFDSRINKVFLINMCFNIEILNYITKFMK